MAKLLEEPERIGSVPVAAIPVEHNGGVVGNTPAAEELLQAFLVEKVAGKRILNIDMPVELHSSWDVSNVVEHHILIGLNEANSGSVQIVATPPRRHQYFSTNIS